MYSGRVKRTWTLTFVLILLLTGQASAKVFITQHEARATARMALENTLGTLLYRSAGTAPAHVSSCRIKGRRAVCHGRVRGSTQTCEARIRILVAGHLPVSDPDSTTNVWSDRVSCH